jgi:hypothetical protein
MSKDIIEDLVRFFTTLEAGAPVTFAKLPESFRVEQMKIFSLATEDEEKAIELAMLFLGSYAKAIDATPSQRSYTRHTTAALISIGLESVAEFADLPLRLNHDGRGPLDETLNEWDLALKLDRAAIEKGDA